MWKTKEGIMKTSGIVDRGEDTIRNFEKVEQEGLTVIFITHDTELAAAWADKIYRLEDTALVEKSAEEVL